MSCSCVEAQRHGVHPLHVEQPTIMRNNVTIWHTSCERCGIVISQIGSGRPRKYCYGSCNPRAPKVRKPKTGGRAQWVRDQKIARGECADCGWGITVENARVFDWDHRQPELKRFELSQIPAGLSIEAVIEEMEKCDVVCRNCHGLRPTSHQGPVVRRCTEVKLEGLFAI